MGGKRADKLDIRASVTQNLKLLLKTMPLRYGFDPSYGSILNKLQFVTPPINKEKRKKIAEKEDWHEKTRENIEKNLNALLTEYEPRLQIKDVKVRLQVAQNRANSDTMLELVIVCVEVEGNLTVGRKEKYEFPDSEVADDAKEIFPLYIPVGSLI